MRGTMIVVALVLSLIPPLDAGTAMDSRFREPCVFSGVEAVSPLSSPPPWRFLWQNPPAEPGMSDRERNYYRYSDAGAGIGLTSSPSTFLMAGEIGFDVGRNLTLGPLLQLGVSDDEFLIAPAINLRYSFPVYNNWERPVVDPSIHGGAGFLYLNEDPPGPRDEEDDIGLLLEFGGGVHFWFTSTFALGTQLRINVLPIEVNDENVILSWEVLSFRFEF